MTKLTVNGLALVDQFTLANKTEDHKEGVAAFLERRKPQLRGRQPRSTTSIHEIKHDGYRLYAGMAFAFAASRATAMTGPTASGLLSKPLLASKRNRS